MGNTFRNRRANVGGAGAELKVTLVAGDLDNTDIPVAGIKKTDELVSVFDNNFVDHTSTTAVTSDGNIQVTTDTSLDKLVVIWWSFG